MGKVFFDDLLDQQFSKKWTSEGSSEGVCQVKKGLYIDPLTVSYEVFTQIRVFDWNFPSKFSFLVKPYFLFDQYRKSVLKKTQISGSNFEPCSSCVAVDSFFPEKMISRKKRPQIQVTYRYYLTIFVQVRQCHFGGRGQNKNFSPPPGVCKATLLELNGRSHIF